MIKHCEICGRAFEAKHKNHKYCSDACRLAMKPIYYQNYNKRKSVIKKDHGFIKISKNMVKAPAVCRDQVTCLECSRKRCRYEENNNI